MPEPAQPIRCESCRHWHTPGGRIGECRIRAPGFVSSIQSEEGNIANKGVWPKTFLHEWCSEHTPKETRPQSDS